MKRRGFARIVFFLAVALGMLAFASPAWAGTFTVNSTADDTDADWCAGADCTLREAILESNQTTADDVIQFSPDQFPPDLGKEIVLVTALPDLGNVQINGPGAGVLTVRRSPAQGTSEFRIFTVAANTSARISDLTVSGGRSTNGGGIRNNGTLTLERSVVSGNTSTSAGGGIFSAITATTNVVGSTVSGNVTTQSSGGGMYIFNGSIAETTVTGNSATTSGEGGGIFADTVNSARSITITGTTVAGNTVGGRGGGLRALGPGTTVRNTVVAGNSAPNNADSFGDFTDGGYNLTGGSAAEAGLETDDSGDPALEQNGGPTPTVALLPGSPAVDKGNSFGSATDQRGQPRPKDEPGVESAPGGDGSDIGAFEGVVPLVEVSDATATEGNRGGGGAAGFTVRLPDGFPTPVRLDYATADDTAASPEDYAATSGTVEFSPGQTTRTITVALNGDTRDEPDETFSVRLSNLRGENIALLDRTAVATITDDDDPPSLRVSNVSVTEDDSGTKEANFVVDLSAPSGKTVGVDYATADGTATAGQDYASTSGRLTFAPGNEARLVSVTVNGDALSEPDETFFLSLSGAENAALPAGRGQATIVNDDPRAQDDRYATDAGTPLQVAAPGLLANDLVSGGAASAGISVGPANGMLSLNADGSFRYVPNAGFTGTDSFTYTFSEGAKQSNAATVRITVSRPPIPPPPPDTQPADTTRPVVLKVSPSGSRVAPGANVTASFNEAMRRSTLNRATVNLVKKGAKTSVPASITVPANNRSVVLNPKRKLVAGATYTATVSAGARDLAGNPLLRAKTWSFKVRR